MSDNEEHLKEIPGKCPTPLELGASGWNILHSSAAVYPYKPSEVQRTAMKNFIESWAHVYACSWCAYHMRDYVRKNPPDVRDKLAVSRYVCELHNEVNERLGKDLFDCSPDVVLRRWHPGYPNKMEDKPTIEEQLAMSEKKKAEAAAAKRRQQEEEERRFSDFGLSTRDAAPREAAGWRETALHNENPKNSASDHNPSGKRWWFFGSSAFNATSKSAAAVPSPVSADTTPTAGGVAEASAAQSVVPPVAATPHVAGAGWNSKQFADAGASALSQTPARKKAANDETDVDAVLERLKRCQVYCPEDEELQKH